METRIRTRIIQGSLCRSTHAAGDVHLYFDVSIDSPLWKNMEVKANLRKKNLDSKTCRELKEAIIRLDEYDTASTPVSVFTSKFLCRVGNNFVSYDTLDNNALALVEEIDMDADCYDGQHRGATFDEVTQFFKTLPESERPGRHSRVSALIGVNNLTKQANIAKGHNTNAPVSNAAHENKLGHLDEFKNAMKEYAVTVEWADNEGKHDSRVIYKPSEIPMMLQGLTNEIIVGGSIHQEKELQTCIESGRYRHFWGVLPLCFRLWEKLKVESEKRFSGEFGTEDHPGVKTMFNGRERGAPKRPVSTHTLGTVACYPLNYRLIVLVMNSVRWMFTIPSAKEISKDTKVAVQAYLAISEETFEAFMDYAVPRILQAISERDKAHLKLHAYIAAKRNVRSAKVKEVPGLASYRLQKLTHTLWDDFVEGRINDVLGSGIPQPTPSQPRQEHQEGPVLV